MRQYPHPGGPRPRRRSRLTGNLLVLVCSLVAVVGIGEPANAQSFESDRQQLQQFINSGPTHADVVAALRSSGMTREQARQRLQQLGYDPALVDRYYDFVDSSLDAPSGQASEDLTQVLNEMGVALRSEQQLAAPAAMATGFDTLAVIPASTGEELPVFGMELFEGATTQFQPVTTGPVDPDYRLGPGDQIYLVLTGDVETALTLDVTREGYIFIPDVGQVLVNGLTMGQLETRLYERLGRVYSGVVQGANASTQFQATLGQLRTNLVYVIGEVRQPGAYQVSSVGTVFSALYAARGPNANGSFRNIEVRRAGEVVRTIDLYRYLLTGDSGDDIRLEQGDIIFVPVVGPQVGIRGAIRRPALYELRQGEGLQHLLSFSGRLEAEALLRRIQIDRILPPEGRPVGVDRVLVDVNVDQLASQSIVPLRDGDVVQVFSVSAERRNRVVLTGEVMRPGVYEWSPGTSVWDVIEQAEGLGERAYTPRAHIFRLNPADGTRTLLRTPLLADGGGMAVDDVPLADLDSVVVYSQAELTVPRTVYISGYVANPGDYSLAAGMTVEDLVLAAGGFVNGADVSYADVARLPPLAMRTDTTAEVVRVSLAGSGLSGAVAANAQLAGLPATPASADPRANYVPAWMPRADEFVLHHGDRIMIRQAPGHESMRNVYVTGEVLTPGSYALQTRSERLADVIARSGGLTEEAYTSGLQLFRRGHLLPTDVDRALSNPNSRFNVELEAGDSIHVPQYDPTVLVTGAVAFDSRVLYQPGRGLDYYIRQAGGYLEDADKRRLTVTHPDGERDTVGRFLFVSFKPEPEPGSVIFVPTRPEREGGINLDQLLTRTLSIASVAASVIIAVDRIQ